MAHEGLPLLGVGSGQLSCQSSAPQWPRMPMASGQEGLNSAPSRKPGPVLASYAGLKQCHLNLQIGAGCLWTRCESRRGGSRPGKQVTLPCMGKCLLPAHRNPPPTVRLELGGRRAAQLWTMDINSSFAGISLGRHMFQLHSPPEASSPQTLQAPGLVETFPSSRQGDWFFPQRTLDSCCSAAAPAGLTTQGPAAHRHGLANWKRQASGSQRQSLWTVPKGWGY